jgi:hypothetical protein
VPYLRLTADRRGFENTFLLHVPAPGERPRVLYWYRTAPGLRIGRPALDDGAMRTLEAQFPDIDFDWPYILDMSAMTPVEVEAPIPPRKRRPRQPDDDAMADDASAPRPRRDVVEAADPEVADVVSVAAPSPATTAAVEPPPHDGPDLLADLLGRGIAASLRVRHRQLRDQLDGREWPDPAAKAVLAARVGAIDPDLWTTPEAVLQGMAGIEAEVEQLRRDLE